jgi:hypothetical protein
MNDLSVIIENCKLNKEVGNDELKYAVIALTSLMNMSMSTLRNFYKNDMKIFEKMRLENIHNAYSKALNKSPKDWLGWDNDPANPEYQKFHAWGSKLVDKALKGELPNQKK